MTLKKNEQRASRDYNIIVTIVLSFHSYYRDMTYVPLERLGKVIVVDPFLGGNCGPQSELESEKNTIFGQLNVRR